MVNGSYKATKSGIIPFGWEALSLRENFDFFQNNTYSRDCLNPSEGNIQNIHYGDVLIKYGTLLDCEMEPIPFINPDIQVNLVKRLVQSGDIIIADTAEDNTVGKATEVINVGKRNVVAGLHTVFFRPHPGLFSERFLGYFINSSAFHDQLLPYIVGTKVSSVSKGSLQETFVLRPPLPEQRAIAAALSDVDGYITALERLIAKKRNIKQGAMQELLTGKRRLPGFNGEWETKKLVDYCSLITKQTGFDYTSYIKPALLISNQPNTLPMIQTINFRGRKFSFNTDYYIPESVAENFPNIILSERCILFSIVGASVGNVGLYPGGFAFCGGAIGITRFYNSQDVEWVYYYLCSQNGQDQIRNVTKGGAQATVTIADIRNFVIPTPTIEERTAIAAILSDMDAEIDALTAKLVKIRNIKQGMMQELLTGRIRLISEEVEPAPVAKPAAKIIKRPKREPQPAIAQTGGHNQQFDDAVMIAGIVNALYSDKYPLGRKKVQKCLYLLRRHQDESTAAFKKKAAGPYADEVRYKGGEPIARSAKYIVTTSTNGKGTTFARGGNISQALGYIQSWGRQADIKWLTDNLKYKKVDDLELLATVDMAICDLEEACISISVTAIKHLIATNAEWKAKLKKQSFSDDNIARAIKELQTLL